MTKTRHTGLWAILPLIFITNVILGQATGEKFKTAGKDLDGFSITVEQPLETANACLERYLEAFGKVAYNDRYFAVTEVQNLGLSETLSIYADTESLEKGSKILVGVEMNKIGEENFKNLEPQLKELLEKFKLNLNSEELEEQLIEAEGAAAYKSRVFQKMVKESSSLETKMQNNREKKKKLEERINMLDEEYITLEDNIELNKELKNLASEELEKINLRIEQLKNELSRF